ncbi:MAG: twin-arginine translocase TatA/TatE family subunit [Candidatus Bathyarchaeia archaeon]
MISGAEWVVIIILILALLIFGPSKIPELAKAIGKARREYEKAAQGEESEEDKIIALAKELGIPTEGKTKDEILSEIKKKVKTESK